MAHVNVHVMTADEGGQVGAVPAWTTYVPVDGKADLDLYLQCLQTVGSGGHSRAIGHFQALLPQAAPQLLYRCEEDQICSHHHLLPGKKRPEHTVWHCECCCGFCSICVVCKNTAWLNWLYDVLHAIVEVLVMLQFHCVWHAEM